MGNFRREIEGKLQSFLHLPIWTVLRGICCYVASLMCKGCKLLGTHKERALALLFFVMEAISVVLDVIGKNKEVFLLAAFLLSAFGFALTLYSCVEEKTIMKTLAERQLKAVEIVFSVIQLIVTFIQFLLTVLQVENSYNASTFPFAFSMIAIVFIFKKDVNEHSPSRDFHLPLVNIQPIDRSISINTPIELDQNGTSSPNLTSPSFNHCDVLSKNIAVLVPEYGVQRVIDLIMFTNYKDLYKELKKMFNIRLYFNKRPKSHWELVYEDDNGDMFVVGDNSWDEFYHNARKLHLYKKKSLRNNFMVNPQQIMHDDVSPPAPLPAEQQQTMMEPVTAYDPHSSRLNDIDMEAPSTLDLEMMTATAPALAPTSVSLDLLEADSEEGLLRLAQAEIEASDVTRPRKKPRLINSDLILLVTEGSMLAAS